VDTRPYHHGALHEALLEAAETILRRDGPTGLTLRAAAREAGVSHAAPAHHFGDLTGLLSELAAVGFARFAAAMKAGAAAAADDPRARLDAIGRAYVGFARENPALFVLMFRSDRLDMSRPALRAAADDAFSVLARARGMPGAMKDSNLTLAQAGAMAASWSLVHGFSMLLIDHRLDPMLRRLEVDADTLLDNVLAAYRS
jgi:AcrR family transcriptional regulator